MPRYLPIALDAEGRRCVVIGGGAVAARRVSWLLESGADVLVVAPAICAEIAAAEAGGSLAVERAAYEAGHLDGALLVVAATDDVETNARVAADARGRGALCNQAGAAEVGDFVVPSLVRRGDLLIAVTTAGRSPSLAARIQRELAERFGPEYAQLVELLGAVRDEAMRTVADPRRRRALLSELAGDEALLSLVRQGRLDEARTRAFSCISSS